MNVTTIRTATQGNFTKNPAGIRDYLETLHPPDSGTAGQVLIYTKKPSFRRRFFEPDDIDGQASYCLELSDAGFDVYTAVNQINAAAAKRRGRYTRGCNKEAAEVMGVGLDIDAGEKEGHNYPSQEFVLRTLAEMPLLPSMIIRSGKEDGGIHAYWLLHEPFTLLCEDGSQNKADAHYASHVSKQWEHLLRKKLKPYELDATADLVRVLRPIGTVNQKYGTTVAAIEFEPNRRYELDDFAEFLPKAEEQDLGPVDDYEGGTVDQPEDLAGWIEVIKANATAYENGGTVNGETAEPRHIADFRFLIDAHRRHWPKAKVWAACSGVSKFATDGLPYFELTWHNAGRKAGNDARDIEALIQPAGDMVPLDDWRDEMLKNRIDSIGQPGLYLDTSPTGSGKSYCDIQAAKAAGSSLTMLPDHANCDELVDKMKDEGMDSAAYPHLTEEVCNPVEWENVKLARKIGVNATAAVCGTCACRESCEYMRRVSEAKKADHTVGCHARALGNLAKLATGKKYVAVHEDPAQLLRPQLAFYCGLGETQQAFFNVREKEIARARRFAKETGTTATITVERRDIDVQREMGWHAVPKLTPQKGSRINAKKKTDYVEGTDIDLIRFCENAIQVSDILLEKLSSATETHEIKFTHKIPAPKNLDRRLLTAIRNCGEHPAAEIMRTVIGVITGSVDQVVVQVNPAWKQRKGGEARNEIVATWKCILPESMPVWFGDATARAGAIEQLSGRAVIDATPAGRLEHQQPIEQLPLDITKGMVTATAAALLRGVLQKHPEAKRVGVIGHKRHIEEMFPDNENEGLDDAARERVRMFAYFGQGLERASNLWQQDCDLLIILGTPRVPTSAVKHRLIQGGQVDEAQLPGAWGKRVWEGRTTDDKKVVVTGLGYKQPAWRAVHEDIVAAELLQCCGRGRTILDDGLPVVVLSTEPLGLPLGDAEGLPKITRQMAYLAEQVAKMHLEADQPLRAAEVAEALGRDRSSVSRELTRLADAGLIHSLGHGKGWAPVDRILPSVPNVCCATPNKTLLASAQQTEAPPPHSLCPRRQLSQKRHQLWTTAAVGLMKCCRIYPANSCLPWATWPSFGPRKRTNGQRL